MDHAWMEERTYNRTYGPRAGDGSLVSTHIVAAMIRSFLSSHPAQMALNSCSRACSFAGWISTGGVYSWPSSGSGTKSQCSGPTATQAPGRPGRGGEAPPASGGAQRVGVALWEGGRNV